jgi:nucleotide-binding universal stress UspA family protein
MTASAMTHPGSELAALPDVTVLSRALPGGLHADRARAALQGSTASVLVLPAGTTQRGLGRRMVVVLTGEAESRCAVAFAARIASIERFTVRYLMHPFRSDDHPTLIPLAPALRALGAEPIQPAATKGSGAAAVCDGCRRFGASLIVVGAWAMPRVRCAASLAERVAQDAACAVLLVRPIPAPASTAGAG